MQGKLLNKVPEALKKRKNSKTCKKKVTKMYSVSEKKF